MRIKNFFVALTALLLFTLPLLASEDWNSIQLPKDALKAEKPVIGQTDDASTFTRQLIRVQWRAGDPIYLFVMVPKLIRKPPVVLYLYSFPTETDRFLNEKFCEQLTKGGFAAVGFASALTGHRYHDRPMKKWFVSELQESLAITTHDVQMILDYLQNRDDVDATRVAMFGEGSGAAIAVLAAAADPRLKAIDLLNPWGDWPDWLAKSSVIPEGERAAYLTPDFLKTVRNLDPVQWLPSLKIPMRLQYMNEGATVPPEARARIEAAAPPQTLRIPSAEALAEYEKTSGAKFLDWLHNQLRPQPERAIADPK